MLREGIAAEDVLFLLRLGVGKDGVKDEVEVEVEAEVKVKVEVKVEAEGDTGSFADILLNDLFDGMGESLFELRDKESQIPGRCNRKELGSCCETQALFVEGIHQYLPLSPPREGDTGPPAGAGQAPGRGVITSGLLRRRYEFASIG